MARPHQLSDLQIAIMRVLWDRGEASVSEVHAALHRERGLAPTTVATLLTRLEKRGLVGHRADGRLFVYAPRVSRDEVQRSMIGHLTRQLFQGDVGAVVSHLLTVRDVTPGDLERVKSLIEAKQRELEDDGHVEQ